MPVDGLMNVYGIPKPNYRAFQLLHWSGDTLVKTTPDLFYNNNETVGVFAVTGNNTSIFIVNWNVMNQPITQQVVQVNVTDVSAIYSRAVIYQIDEKNSNSYSLWVSMGKPLYLTPKQVSLLSEQSELVPQPLQLKSLDITTVQFEVTIPPNSLINVVIY